MQRCTGGWQMSSNTVTLIGKGPSAAHAVEWMATEPGADVAVVNDAGLLLPAHQQIDWLFFADAEQIESARVTWGRVERFVCPDALHVQCRPSIRSAAEIEGFPVDRCEMLRYGDVVGVPASSFASMIDRRLPPWKFTCTGAAARLAYHGYSRVRLIGFDGGTGHVPGVRRDPLKVDYTKFRAALQVLCGVLSEKLGTEFEWWKP